MHLINKITKVFNIDLFSPICSDGDSCFYPTYKFLDQHIVFISKINLTEYEDEITIPA